MSSTIAACRVVWFRSRAAAARCVEEVALLEEEMRRTVRFFKYYEGDWQRKAIAAQNAGLGGQAAYARRSVMLTRQNLALDVSIDVSSRQAHTYQRLLDKCKTQFALHISLVR